MCALLFVLPYNEIHKVNVVSGGGIWLTCL